MLPSAPWGIVCQFLCVSENQATSENTFLMDWTEDFDPDKVMGISEYFVYFGIIITHRRSERFGQAAKGAFLELQIN